MNESGGDEDFEARKYLGYVQKYEEANVYWSDLHQSFGRIAADFGKLGLQSVLLLNGAALGVLPALLSSADIKQALISQSAGWFVTGIILSVLAVLLAYFNYSLLADIERPREKHLKDLAIQYGYQTQKDESTKAIDSKSRVYESQVEITRWLAVVLCLGAFGAFVKGVYVLL